MNSLRVPVAIGRVQLRKTTSQSRQKIQHQWRWMGSGTRGSRGHGWLHKYRAGLGGRHLQGRYHDRDSLALSRLNDDVFSLNDTSNVSGSENSSVIYIDLEVGDRSRDSLRQQSNEQNQDQKGKWPTKTRITIDLATTALPLTCANFKKFCQESGGGGYANTSAFRIVKGVGICFGDLAWRDTESGVGVNPSHLGGRNFHYEPPILSHSTGILTMLGGMDSGNDSRFLITLKDSPQLDGRYVPFGRVRDGLDDLLSIANGVFTKKERPVLDIRIKDCGVLQL